MNARSTTFSACLRWCLHLVHFFFHSLFNIVLHQRIWLQQNDSKTKNKVNKKRTQFLGCFHRRLHLVQYLYHNHFNIVQHLQKHYFRSKATGREKQKSNELNPSASVMLSFSKTFLASSCINVKRCNRITSTDKQLMQKKKEKIRRRRGSKPVTISFWSFPLKRSPSSAWPVTSCGGTALATRCKVHTSTEKKKLNRAANNRPTQQTNSASGNNMRVKRSLDCWNQHGQHRAWKIHC